MRKQIINWLKNIQGFSVDLQTASFDFTASMKSSEPETSVEKKFKELDFLTASFLFGLSLI